MHHPKYVSMTLVIQILQVCYYSKHILLPSYLDEKGLVVEAEE